MSDIKHRLEDMGFTALEADIYLHLLQHGATTGYAVAKAIGKAVANTYKGIESLRSKGAVEVSDSDKSRTCRAVPWRTFLDSHKRAYEANLSELESALESLTGCWPPHLKPSTAPKPSYLAISNRPSCPI